MPRIGYTSKHMRLAAAAVIAVLLLIPAIANLISNSVMWTAEDFAAAALLLASAWIGIEAVIAVTSSNGIPRMILAESY